MKKAKGNVLEKNLKKMIKYLSLLSIIIILLGISILSMQENKKTSETEKENISTTSRLANAEYRDAQEIGKIAKVTASQITQRKTGTGPFDNDNNPGNDQNDSNDVVRSFDQVTWTTEYTIGLKNGSTSESYRGGVLEVSASLPNNCANIMKWDLDAMKWAEEPTVSDNGIVFSASYSMSTNEITIPGKQTIVFVLKVSGATNGFTIEPTFSVKLKGNTDNEKVTIGGTNSQYPTAVRVSSIPKYDIELKNYDQGYSVSYNGQERKVYKYALAFRLYGDNASKGIKGIEMPKGDINFDINYMLRRTQLAQTDYTNITNNMRLCNYKYIDNKKEFIGSGYKIEAPDNFYIAEIFPFGIGSSREAVYKNGNLNMVDYNNGTIRVTISNYAIDPDKFPDRLFGVSYTNENEKSIEQNIGYVSLGLFYMEVDMNAETTMENTQCYIDLNATNLSVSTQGGGICNSEVKNDNNNITATHITLSPGDYHKENRIYGYGPNRSFKSVV